VFVKIATLAVVGITLHGCGDLLNLLGHLGTSVTACNEALLEASAADHEKWVNEFRHTDDNDTAECVAQNLKMLILNQAFECSQELLNETDTKKEPDEDKIKKEAKTWAEQNYKDPLLGNTTLQEEVKNCGSVQEVEEKYSMASGTNFNDQKTTSMNTNFNVYIVAAGFGMVVAALAGMIHRHASTASLRTDMDVEQESVLLEESEDAK